VTYAEWTGAHVGGDPADVYIDREAYDADSTLHPVLHGLDAFDNVDMGTGLISDWIGKWFMWANIFRDRDNVTVLLRLDTDSYACNCPELKGDQPALWITDHVGGPEGGSTSHFLVGGSDKMFAIARAKGIKLVIKNLMQYLAGYEPLVSSISFKSMDDFNGNIHAKERSQFILHQNPVNNAIVVNLPDMVVSENNRPDEPVSLSMFDLQGKMVYTQKIAGYEKSFVWRAEGFRAGGYIMILGRKGIKYRHEIVLLR
jgi:hypothetical protein